VKTLYKALGSAVVLALLGYFVYFIVGAFDWRALQRLASVGVVLAIASAAVLYGLIIPISASAWRGLLPRSTRTWSVAELSAIMGVTQLAKYVPGNVAQHATRSVFALARGMRLRDFLGSVAVETLLAMLAGLVVGLAGLAATGRATVKLPDGITAILPWAVGALVLLLLAMPLLVAGAVRISQRTRWRELVLYWRDAVPEPTSQLFAFVSYCVNYLLIGLGFLLIAHAMGLDGRLGYGQLTAAFALSWLAGFLAPGMPAGLGVREGVLAIMLGGGATDGATLAAILAMRLSTVAGDLGWFFVGGWLLAKIGRGEGND
jgi:hypothetical protein